MRLKRIAVLVAKDFQILRRDFVALVFLLLAPIVVISVAGLSLSTFYGGWQRPEAEYLFPVVDLDKSDVSEELISSLEKVKDLRLVMVDEEEARRLVAYTNRAAAAFGVLVAVLAPSRDSVLPLGTIAIMVMVSVGGCWWPITIEPPWLQSLAHLFPTAWAMQAFNDLMLRERGLVDIWPALAALTAFGALYLVAGLWIYLRRKERYQ